MAKLEVRKQETYGISGSSKLDFEQTQQFQSQQEISTYGTPCSGKK